MKRILMFAMVAAVAALAGNAQQDSDLIEEGQLWKDARGANDGKGGPILVGLQIGANICSIDWEASEQREYGSRAGLNIGVNIEKPINYTWGVKSGLLFSMKGGNYTQQMGSLDLGQWGGSYDLGEYKTSFNPSFLEIPVMASYKIRGIMPKQRIDIDAGFYAAYGIGGNMKREVNGEDANSGELYDYFDRFDFGFKLGVSWVFNTKASLGVGYERSLIGVCDKAGGDACHYSNFMINLGVNIWAL